MLGKIYGFISFFFDTSLVTCVLSGTVVRLLSMLKSFGKVPHVLFIKAHGLGEGAVRLQVHGSDFLLDQTNLLSLSESVALSRNDETLTCPPAGHHKSSY